jgi:hypothetical protein
MIGTNPFFLRIFAAAMPEMPAPMTAIREPFSMTMFILLCKDKLTTHRRSGRITQ